MTENQNMNKTSIKDVQHFLFKTGSICVCLFDSVLFLAGLWRLKQMNEPLARRSLINFTFYRQPLELGNALKPFSYRFPPEN